MIVIEIFLVLVLFYSVYYKSKRYLHMIQQNLYNENNRYIKWLWKNRISFASIDLIAIGISLAGLFVVYDIELISVISLLANIFILLIIGYQWDKTIVNDQNKKKLVVTARIKRLIITLTLIYFLPFLLLTSNITNMRLLWEVVLLENILIYLNSIIVFIAMLINTPMERLVYLHYKRKAKQKIKEMKQLKIIGITGSYGKTSCKNILADILNCKYNALPTPKNLNTFNGLIMTINNYMDKFTDIFIAEMGAYVKGEIKGLCNLVKPQYGILTTIGKAHLESFGSQENIQQGKFELIESLPDDGFGILNGDDPLQQSYKLKNKVKIIWIGINNKKVDLRAENIKCSNKGTSFDIIKKNDEKKYHFETRLLGKHNVYNILSAVACGIEFGIDMEDLIQAVKSVKPIEHRLEIKKIGNFYQIDDAYNSNPIGAKNACEILGMMPGMKIVVTPGMIELGDKQEEENKKFGEEIAKVADQVILIGEKQTKSIKEGILTKGFDKEKIIIFNDVREAYPYLNQLSIENEVYALFENDLPDTFNEK